MSSVVKLFISQRKLYKALGLDTSRSQAGRSACCISGKSLFLLAASLQLFVSTTAFFLFEAKTVEEYGMSFYVSVTVLILTGYTSIIAWRIERVFALMEACDEFIENKLKLYASSKPIYIELNKNIELACKIHYLIMKFTYIMIILPQMLITGVEYFVYDHNDEAFFLTCPVMLPFDWRTPCGYVAALLVQFSAAYAVMCGVLAVSGFLVGSCWFFYCIIQDIQRDLKQLNCKKGNIRNVTVHFHHIVRFYLNAKQLTDTFNEIHGVFITGHIFWSRLGICSSLLVVHLQLSERVPNPKDFVFNLLMVFWAYVSVLAFCTLGEIVTQQFDAFYVGLCNKNWYSFPIELQRMLAIFIGIAQKSATIHGSGHAICRLRTFKKTCDDGFFYYIMIRKIKG